MSMSTAARPRRALMPKRVTVVTVVLVTVDTISALLLLPPSGNPLNVTSGPIACQPKAQMFPPPLNEELRVRGTRSRRAASRRHSSRRFLLHRDTRKEGG